VVPNRPRLRAFALLRTSSAVAAFLRSTLKIDQGGSVPMQARSTKAAGNRFAVQTAAAAALATGVLAAPGFAYAGETRTELPALNKKLEKQVAAAERAVLKAPRDVVARLKLGQSYLAAGRFGSAAASFEDAVSLGDQSPATALRMALSYMGAGRNVEAVALLQQWRDAIPAGDYGLALALAGQPAQAVAVLGEAIKQGENTPKARQNLAYAYALGGRLREARVIAAQDVPADQLEARISDWALQGSIGSQQSRLAAMLGAPLRSDQGRPAALALSAPSDAPVFAAREMPTPPPAAQSGELPPLEGAAMAMAPVFAQEEPQAARTPEPVVRRLPAQFAAAVPAAPQAPMSREPVEQATSGARFVSNAVVQDISRYEPSPARAAAPSVRTAAVALPPRRAKVPTPAPVPAPARPATAKPAPVRAAGAGHAVQLGSFLSEDGARRAWDVYVNRDPSLREREMRITQAVVNGRRYWRVAAAGYDASTARSMCSAVRSRGRDCLAYAERQPRSGSLPSGAVAQRLARR
jgi:Flp pilus assembly protein TadD